MATVITNLLSAIPVFGQDLVESNYATELFSCLLYEGNSLPLLATIGTVRTQALKRVRKLRLSKEELNQILKIKSGMNNQRLEFNINDLPKRSLTLFRFLGFVEGDGSFYTSNMTPTFSIKQHSKNVHFFYEIAEFLNKLPYCPEIGPKIDKLNTRPTPVIYQDSPNTCNLSVVNILQIYNYILPFFKNLEFKSRPEGGCRF